MLIRVRLTIAAALLLCACVSFDKPHSASESRNAPLELGKESMTVALNLGSLPIADDLLNNVWPARGNPSVQLEWPLTWVDDPYSDNYWRFMFYSLQYANNLLWAYFSQQDDRYLHRYLAILDSYSDHDVARTANRLTFDAPYSAAYRAMVLVNSYRKLEAAGKLSLSLAAKLHASIGRLGTFLMDSNNWEETSTQGFGEASALLLVADNFPELDVGGAWRTEAMVRVKQMLTSAIDVDGVQIGNSPNHHFSALSAVSELTAWAQNHESELYPTLAATEAKMLHFAAAVVQPDGYLPMLGATSKTSIPGRNVYTWGSLTSLDANFEYVYSNGAKGKTLRVGWELFRASGLFLIRSARPSGSLLTDQTFVTFDAGPYRTSHSHLDALHLTYYASGAALLPDSGLGTYDLGSVYDYFHGTRAHNTVVVDGLDQGQGSAVALTSGNSGASYWATAASLLYNGVKHTRTVIVVAPDLMVVCDDLTSDAPHRYVQTWHLFPEAVTVERHGKDVVAFDASSTPRVALSQAEADTATLGAPLVLDCVRGQDSPMQGWHAADYGRWLPAWVAEYSRVATSAAFVTLVASGKFAGTAPVITQTWSSADRTRTIAFVAGSTAYNLTLTAQGEDTEILTVRDAAHDGP